MIRVVCACGRVFKAEDRHAGKRTKCPVCGALLTIGQTPVSSSSGGDVDEVPSWWYPSDPQGQVDGSGFPPRSGSDPEAIPTAILPPGAEPKVAAQRPHPSRPSTPVPGARLPAPAPPSSRVRRLWMLSVGTAALAVSALVCIVAMRSVAPGGGAAPAATRDLPALPAKSRNPGGDPPALPPPESWRAAQPPSSLTESANEPSAATAKAALPSGSPTESTGPGRLDANGSPRPTARIARRLRLLVPAYIYPSGEGRKHWQKLIEAAAQVEVVAIANPSSGPGRERNPDYAAMFTEAANQGVKLIGYVNTQYAGRSRAEVKEDIDAWVRYYPQIAGFFFDQQPREAEYHHLDYYAELRTYAQATLHDPLLITNPGIACDAAYLARAIADATCVFANYEGFAEFELPAPLRSYDASRFAALVYNVAEVQAMRAAVQDAVVKKIGYIYVSDEKPPVRWGRLPLYWEAEVGAVSRLQ